MKASEVVFQRLLDGNIQYRVPLFQRTYNWRDKEWDRLWTDVLEIYAMTKPRKHFIGAVVTQPIPDAPERAAKHLLIDGQQRFTTILILLTCIWKRAIEAIDQWPGLAEEIQDTCLTNKHVPNVEDRIKFRPTQRDRQSFDAVINGDDVGIQGGVFSAWEFFMAAIEEGDLEGDPLDLRKLKLCITHYLDLVSITLDPEDSPHRIFESLNNTGMRLGSSDLIRNFVFMSIPDESTAQDSYDRYWFPMQEATGEDLDDFFWRYLMMDGSLPRSGETFDEIKERLEPLSAQTAVSALEEFSKFAHYYRRIGEFDPNEPDGPFSQRANRLNRWEVDVAYPFLMKALNWEEDGHISSSQLVTTMKMIESFVVRRTVCSVPTNRLRRVFARMSVQADRSNFVASARDYLMKNQWPSDEEFKEKFVRFRVYLRGRLDRTKLILETLERSFGHKEAPEIGEGITIEHVMPQTLNEDWRAMLGPDAAVIHSQWLDTLGNLTLTGYNPELSNADFHKKKELLKDSNFALTEAILDCDQWNEETIEERAKSLAERAVGIWER